MPLNGPPLFLRGTFNNESHRQINARTGVITPLNIVDFFVFGSFLHHWPRMRMQLLFFFPRVLQTRSAQHFDQVLNMSELRELMLSVAVQRHWPNYVIKGE